jgi:formylglycine-generating enzyme required for sulfatase activity
MMVVLSVLPLRAGNETTELETLRQQLATVDFDSVRRLIKKLAAAYPEKFKDPDKILSEIDKYEEMMPNVASRLESGDERARQQCIEILKYHEQTVVNFPPKTKTELEALAEEFSFVDLPAMKRAVRDLAATYPERFGDEQEYLRKIKQYDQIAANLRRQLKASDRSVMAKCREILEFQREILVNRNPAVDFKRILFTKRRDYVNPGDFRREKSVGLAHNYHANCSVPKRDWFSELGYIDIRNPCAPPEFIYKPEDGSFVGDIDLHFDTDKMLFSSVDADGRWQVFEMNADGSGLRQVTPGTHRDIDSFDPMYLPDGRILYVSTAGFQGVPCVQGGAPVGNLHIMNPDGSGIRRLTFEQDHDWHPTLLSNGRVMYTRWEYTDTPHYYTRVLMSMNPDGTGQVAHYGSNSYWPTAMFFARPLPEKASQFVAVVSGHHGARRAGELYLFDVAKGRTSTSGVMQRIPNNTNGSLGLVKDQLVRRIWPRFLHPYPITDKHFLVAMKPAVDAHWGLYYVDVFDNIVLLREDEGFALMEPIPYRKTKRPPILADKVDLTKKTGIVHIQDIYSGDGLKGVPRGVVKRLRVFEYVYGFRGFASWTKIGIEGPWDVHRILGTVPVYEDGSASFVVPANRPIAFQPLDSKGRSLQMMRSWTSVMPGENIQCAGCHEDQNSTIELKNTVAVTAEPAHITPWYGPARGFSFAREVQPVLDRYCVGCHDGTQQDVSDLTGGASGHKGGFSRSYIALEPYVRRTGCEGNYQLLPPLNFHASTSELIQMLEKGHKNVSLDEESWERLYTWIDLNVPFYGTWTECGKVHNCYERRVLPGLTRRNEMNELHGGEKVDTELIHEADYDTTFIMPEKEEPGVNPPNVANWPFDAIAAKKMQGDAATQDLDLGGGVTMKIRRIPAGEFIMGSATESRDERPLCKAKIANPFWIGECEVTVKQFRQFKRDHSNGYIDLPGVNHGAPGGYIGFEEYPVVRVSWQEAMNFCRWLSNRTGRTVSLPTEAQWEWSCRAGTDTPLYFGDVGPDFFSYANIADISASKIAQNIKLKETCPAPKVGGRGPGVSTFLQRVSDEERRFRKYIPAGPTAHMDVSDGAMFLAVPGQYKPNTWGLYDMHGNAAEWTQTSFRPYPYDPEKAAHDEDCQGKKVVRGGSWRDRLHRCTSSYRLAYPKWQKVYNVGFRIVICD